MFQLTHKKEPVHTIPIAPQPKVLPQALEENQFLSSGPEDCEPSVELEDFGKGGVEVEPEDSGEGGVGVEVESEYDLELRIGGNVGRPGMTVQSVRW